MEGTVTDVSDASYCLSQETVETEEEHLSQDRDLDAKDIAGSKTYLVYESSLLRLMRKCYVCRQIVVLKTSTRGTLLVVQGSCPDGHKLCWEFQPMVKGIASGNLALSAAILFCGLTYTKVANRAMLLNMPIFSESTFHRLQKEYLYPVVHTAYVQQQRTVTEFLRGKPLQLSGDGRCDSPGHSAKYCTYSLMDSVTDLILDYSLVQVTEQWGDGDGLFDKCAHGTLSCEEIRAKLWQYFSYMGMQARTELAIIDHNHNTDREQAVTAAGQLRYKLEYSKRTKKWVVKAIAEHKQHDYLLDMMSSSLDYMAGMRILLT
eukprot:Em0016g458a